jgi:LacI family transcriptional regulator
VANIKEIAQLANVSQATASMVLNNKGDQYRISTKTQQRIFEAAKQLNYQPNISARRLRSGGEVVLPIIALFWALDTRTVLMSRFLKGLQEVLQTMEEEHELLIQPYVGTKLSEVHSLMTGTRFNAAIIANTTEDDDAFLEQSQLNVPIVLYQRSSDKYASVNVNSFHSGEEVARLFASRGHKKVGVLIPDVSSQAIKLRKEGFLSRAVDYGLEIAEEHIVFADYSEQGGYRGMNQLMAGNGVKPSAIFVISDQMAVGALSALNLLGIQVPKELELIGHDDDVVAEFTIPALSTVHLPVEKMAGECLNLLLDIMHHKSAEPDSKILNTYIVVRNSCGPFLT